MPFVSFEGIDGSGKSTQAAMLSNWLVSQKLEVILTSEPSGGRIGRAVRAILVEENGERPLSVIEELLLVCAARCDHVRSVIAPALAAGAWVISDRFFDSTFAFQVFETGIDPELFRLANQASTGGVVPDLTFVLDIEPNIGLLRRESRFGSANADPAESHRDFDRIRRGLVSLERKYPDRCRVIDASKAEEDVAEAVRLIVSRAKFVSADGGCE